MFFERFDLTVRYLDERQFWRYRTSPSPNDWVESGWLLDSD